MSQVAQYHMTNSLCLVLRQLKQVEEFLAKNGVKTVRKLKAAKFEDLIFTNGTPQVSRSAR